MTARETLAQLIVTAKWSSAPLHQAAALCKHCSEARAAADAILAAGWRPPLPDVSLSREGLGRDVCDIALKWSREDWDRRGGQATWETLSDDLRELYMRIGESLFQLGQKHPSSPLPDSETEWGCRDRHGRVHSVGVENETHARSMRSMTPVRREVGPWTKVQP